MVVGFAFLFQRKLIKKEKAFREIEKMLKKQELDSAYNILSAQELERKRIAQEIHDNLGSMLAVVRMQAYTSGANPSVMKLIDQTIDETRRISHQLDTLALSHFGLATAIQQLTESVKGSGDIDVALELNLQVAIEQDKALQLYRIVQELFSNTLKHAAARRIRVELNAFAKDAVNLIFEDNGRGFDPASRRAGMGLQNIRQRVEHLRGRLDLDTRPGSGTTVVIEIPLAP
jgi:hypothetical protein